MREYYLSPGTICRDEFRTETNPTPTRQTEWMSRWILILGLAAVLITSAMACPLWMSAHSHCPMPCPNGGTSERCPLSVCQASSPYLASHVTVHPPPVDEVPAAMISSVFVPWITANSTDPIAEDNGPPSGQSGHLFLRIHSLLI